MTRVKYSLLVIFTIALIIIAWIFFTSKSEEEIPEIVEFQVAENALSRQVPRDNDASYSFPVYIPTHSHSQPRAKVEFQTGGDNDALYSMPVELPVAAPVAAPKKTPIKFAEQPRIKPAAPAVPVAPLQPRPRQPETPVYVPQYQQPQYQPQYQQPAAQPQAPATNEDEAYPYYYY